MSENFGPKTSDHGLIWPLDTFSMVLKCAMCLGGS